LCYFTPTIRPMYMKAKLIEKA